MKFEVCVYLILKFLIVMQFFVRILWLGLGYNNNCVRILGVGDLCFIIVLVVWNELLDTVLLPSLHRATNGECPLFIALAQTRSLIKQKKKVSN